MSTSRGIKVVAVLAFIALFAPCLGLTSYAADSGNFVEPYPVFCVECSKSFRFDHQKALAGGEWAKNSILQNNKAGDFVEPYPVFCRECSKSYPFDHQKALGNQQDTMLLQ